MTWFPSAKTMDFLNTCTLRTVEVPTGYADSWDYASNVQPIHRGLAGMVLAATTPEDECVVRGVRLAKLAGQLVDLFPQLQTRSSLGDDELEFVIDPLKREYFDKVAPCLNLHDLRYISFYCDAGHLIARDITPEEMGAFLWKTRTA
jgi:hypothetical protein